MMISENFKKKWGFRISAGNILLILLGTLINLAGSNVASYLSLPWWLDSIGTFISAVFLGPIAGAISGVLMNVIKSFYLPGQIWFSIVSICGGLAVGRFFPRDRKIDSFSVIATALFAGFVMTVVSTPLNLYFNDGYTGNEWGDALTIMLSDYMNMKAFRCFMGGLLVNMPDKAISILIALSVLYIARKVKKKTPQAAGIILFLAVLSAGLLLPSAKVMAGVDVNSEYAAVHYGISEGLVSTEINTIEQTADGYLWAGAYSGLYRYDGKTFEQMHLDDRINNVICLYEDSGDRLWIGTNDSGVACYDTKSEAISFYTTKEGLSADAIRSICEDEAGNIYVGTTAELCRITDGQIKVYDEYPEIRCVYSLMSMDNGRIAGVTHDGILILLDQDQLIAETESDNPDIAYTAVASGTGNEILVGTSTNKLYWFEQDERKGLVRFGDFDVKGMSYVNHISYSETAQGYLIGASKGLYLADGAGHTTDLSKDTFYQSVSDAITDSQGNLWFCSSKQGILKFSPAPFTLVTQRAGMRQTAVNAVLPEGDRLYVGTDDGMFLLDLKHNNQIEDDVTKHLFGIRVRHMMRDKDQNLWISAYGGKGLYQYKPDGTPGITQDDLSGILGNRFRFTMELTDGTILAASTEGLNYIKDGNVVGVIGHGDGIEAQVLTAVEKEDGEILAGTDGGGICRIKDQKVIGTITQKQGLESLVVLRIVRGNGGYFYVTSNGLYFHRDGENTCSRLSAFPYNNDYDIYISPEKNAFVSSSAGIYVVREDDLIADEGYEPILLNTARGFFTTLTANAWNGIDGDDLYLCCTDGACLLNTASFNKLDENYEIALSSVTEEMEEVPLLSDVYRIPEGKGRLQIMPAVLNYAISNPYVSMQLLGTDEQPVLIHQNEMRDLIYTNLPYGDHVLEIKVIDELSGEVKKEQTFRFHKDAQLYEKTYYKVYLVAVATMLVGFLAWMVAKMGNMAIINRQYEQIRRAKEEAEYANQAKSRFLANMSHEIRTPINAVLGMDEMILRESSEPEIRSYATDIYSAGNTLLSLINDILDSSKIESGRMELQEVEYETAELLRNLKNMIGQRATAKDLQFIVEADETMPCKLFGDDVRIRQIITNMLSNAVKYTHEGSVWLRAKGSRQGDELILHIEVEDTGIGIREEDLPKLFEAYQRIEEGRNRHIEGTGLGMNITVSLLSLMGSKLRVESVYGKGSKFYFDLKQKIVDDAPMGSIDRDLQASMKEGGHESGFTAPDAKLLVVDDNAMNRKVFISLLKQTKMQILQAGSGREALNLVQKELENESVFDMVFMDHMMPDMDGVETMEHMRKIPGYDKVPIFVLTANAVTGAREQYLQAGFDGFLSKPIVSSKLEAAILETLPKDLIGPGEAIHGYGQGSGSGLTNSGVTNIGTGAESGQNAGQDISDLELIDGLDWDFAFLHLPDREMLLDSVSDFAKTISYQADKLDRMKQQEDWEGYRILVHGMKSAAATIGIVPLAGMAKILENASRDGDLTTIESLHDIFLAKWRGYETLLSGITSGGSANGDGNAAENGEEIGAVEGNESGNGSTGKEGTGSGNGNSDAQSADAEMILAMLAMLEQALSEFEVDEADSIMEKMASYSYDADTKALIQTLEAAVKDLDTDGAEKIITDIRNRYA